MGADRATDRPARRSGPDPGPRGPVVAGLETGGDHTGVALWRLPEAGGEPTSRWTLLESATVYRGQRHADLLLGLLDAMLRRHGLAAADLALVAAGLGPGGFTGIRVGLSTALGLSVGTAAPVWPVSSLAVLARNAAASPALALPLLDARKGEVYGAVFEVPAGSPPAALVRAEVGPPESVVARLRAAAPPGRDLLVFGSGALAYGLASPVPPGWHVPSAAETALLAAYEWEAAGRDGSKAPPVDPTYVRPSDAEIDRAKRLGGGDAPGNVG